MKLRCVGLALAASACLAPAAHATNGYFSHGFGIKSQGMAGVGIALPLDSMAAAANPAGMAFVGNRADFGLSVFRPDRSAEIVGNGGIPQMGVPSLDGSFDGNERSSFLIPEFGYNRMVRPDLAVGLAVYGNGGMNSSYANSPFARLGGVGSAGVDLTQMFIAPSVAWRINDRNAVGVALNLVVQQFSASGLQPFAMMSTDPAKLTNQGHDTSTGVSVRVGWIGQVSDAVTLGATYQSRATTGKFDKYSGLFSDQGMFDIPATYGVGIAVKATPKWTIAADVQTIQYSSIESISNVLASGPLGDDGGVGFGWRDMTVVKLGTSWDVRPGLTLRAGVSHGRQPIPSSQTFLNILAPGVVEDHLTLGATWALGQNREVSVAYTHAFKKTVNGANSIPASFGGGEANITLKEDVLGVSLGMKF